MYYYITNMIINVLIYLIETCLSLSLSLYLFIELNVDEYVSHLKHAVIIILSAYLIQLNLI